MFKRRKPDEAPAQPGSAGAPLNAPPNTPASPQPSNDFGATIPGGSLARATGTADNGLDVPPFRQAATPVAGPAHFPAKDFPAMGRAPFAPSPTPAPNQPPQGMSTQGMSTQGMQPQGMQPGSGMQMQQPRPAGAPGRPMGNGAERRTLVVGRGISLQGVVQDAERLVVEGTVEATMIHATELAVAPGGMFKGEVEVEDAEVAGTIDGTLTARGNLIVRATGRVLGTARCRRLQVEDGGQITGRMEMLTESSSSPHPDVPRHEPA